VAPRKHKSKSLPTRHSERCSICRSPARPEIEQEFCAWVPQNKIVRDHRIGGRSSLARHATALGLYEKRNSNVRLALAAFIERGSRAKVTGAAFVAAIVALSKIDERGRTVERTVNETGSNLRRLYERMTRAEMRQYAERGVLPEWFKSSLPGASNRAAIDSTGETNVL
jgi:hypothetical protein